MGICRWILVHYFDISWRAKLGKYGDTMIVYVYVYVYLSLYVYVYVSVDVDV